MLLFVAEVRKMDRSTMPADTDDRHVEGTSPSRPDQGGGRIGRRPQLLKDIELALNDAESRRAGDERVHRAGRLAALFPEPRPDRKYAGRRTSASPADI